MFASVALNHVFTDEDLAQCARLGDPRAETEIVRRHAPDILAMAMRLLADPGEAEDVTQETFINAFDAWAQLREPSKLKGWLSTIAFRLAHRRFRRRRAQRRAGLCPNVDDSTLESIPGVDCSAEIRTELALLALLLARVTGKVREAWLLHHVEGLPIEFVAAKCGCSESTIKRRLAKAQKLVSGFCAADAAVKESALT